MRFNFENFPEFSWQPINLVSLSFSIFRCHLWIQRLNSRFRIISRIRDQIDKSQADKRFPIRWHEHLQHCRVVLNHCTCGHGDSIATGCLVRFRSVGCYLLLLSQHVADLCAKSEYKFSCWNLLVISLNWKMLSYNEQSKRNTWKCLNGQAPFSWNLKVLRIGRARRYIHVMNSLRNNTITSMPWTTGEINLFYLI